VCQQVLATIGAGKAGGDVRKALRASTDGSAGSRSATALSRARHSTSRCVELAVLARAQRFANVATGLSCPDGREDLLAHRCCSCHLRDLQVGTAGPPPSFARLITVSHAAESAP